MACLRLLSGSIASCGDEIALWYIPMSSALRLEYLAALGLETWVVRGKSTVSRETALPDALEAPAPRDVPAPRDRLALRDMPAPRDAHAPPDPPPPPRSP